MADKDIALGILQAAIAIGGLLLIFIGFLLGRSDQTTLASKRNKIKAFAIAGLVPFLAALECALQSIWAIQGAHESALYLFVSLKIVLFLTAFYAIIATFFDVR